MNYHINDDNKRKKKNLVILIKQSYDVYVIKD